MFQVTRYPLISKTESGRVGYRKKYQVAGRVRVPAGHLWGDIMEGSQKAQNHMFFSIRFFFSPFIWFFQTYFTTRNHSWAAKTYFAHNLLTAKKERKKNKSTRSEWVSWKCCLLYVFLEEPFLHSHEICLFNQLAFSNLAPIGAWQPFAIKLLHHFDVKNKLSSNIFEVKNLQKGDITRWYIHFLQSRCVLNFIGSLLHSNNLSHFLWSKWTLSVN